MWRNVIFAWALSGALARMLVAPAAHAEDPPKSVSPSSHRTSEERPSLASAPSARLPAATGAAGRVAPPNPLPPPASLRVLAFRATKRNAELQVEEHDGWRTVCTGHCDALVLVGRTYRVSGSDVTTSKEFVVDDRPFPLVLEARAGSSAAHSAGVLLVPVGGVTLLAGLLVWAAQSVHLGLCTNVATTSNGSTTCNDPPHEDHGISAAAAVPIVAGSALLATGIVLLAGQRTKLRFSSVSPLPTVGVKFGRAIEVAPDGLRF